MKNYFAFILALFVVSVQIIRAQTVTVYRSSDGKDLSITQRDSIANLGYPIAVKEKVTRNDSVIYFIDIYEKRPLLSPFQITFQGKVLPEMEFLDINGKTFNLPIKGKVTFVNFWSVTCGPCIVEIPQLNELFQKYKGEVLFLGISPDSKDQIKKFLAKTKFDFTVISDPKVFEKYHIDGYPKNLFIDQNGNVIVTKEGTPQSRKSLNEDWKISVFEDYGAIIQKLLRDKNAR